MPECTCENTGWLLRLNAKKNLKILGMNFYLVTHVYTRESHFNTCTCPVFPKIGGVDLLDDTVGKRRKVKFRFQFL